jgi:hypothetical protein
MEKGFSMLTSQNDMADLHTQQLLPQSENFKFASYVPLIAARHPTEGIHGSPHGKVGLKLVQAAIGIPT